MLQNAEDAEATTIRFVQYDDRLEVFHNGRPFTNQNLVGLCDIGKSDKVKDLNQIGEFGVGFKSVFSICETVRLYSDPSRYKGKISADTESFAVEILNFTQPEDIPEVSLPSEYTTRFVFPYAVGKSFSGFDDLEYLKTVLYQTLSNLGISTLLFMKHLSEIEYQARMPSRRFDSRFDRSYHLDKQKLDSMCDQITAIGPSGRKEEISYLLFKRKIGADSHRTVDLAFSVIQKEDQSFECIPARDHHVSVYFPTDTESKLGFIVQGPYRTTPNRGSIPAENKDNIKLAEETAALLEESLKELRNMGLLNMSFLKVLPINSHSFDDYALFSPLYQTVKQLFVSEDMIPRQAGGYVRARCAKICRSELLQPVYNNSKCASGDAEQCINENIDSIESKLLVGAEPEDEEDANVSRTVNAKQFTDLIHENTDIASSTFINFRKIDEDLSRENIFFNR